MSRVWAHSCDLRAFAPPIGTREILPEFGSGVLDVIILSNN